MVGETLPRGLSNGSRMTANARIAELERRLTELQGTFVKSIRLTQHLGGRTRMFESAVLALIASHPSPKKLVSLLSDQLDRTDLAIVKEAISEDHVNGAKETKRVIELALAEAVVPRRR